MLTLEEIRQQLANRPPLLVEGPDRHAAVALVLRQDAAVLQMLIIRRAEHECDPWSGDLAFPGGKVDPGDADARAAAERETAEEIGLDLTLAEFLGQLDDLPGAFLPVRVSCFVYFLPCPAHFRLNHEVADYQWLPLDRFHEQERHRKMAFPFRGRTTSQPVVDLIDAAPVLWGITHRLVTQFFERIEKPMPTP
ncbi:MAG: CoA pyrophosphatase [Desulfuromonadales bacterium]|nr:CoA pyrophosphatase [Desulfuromonadales bacterium]